MIALQNKIQDEKNIGLNVEILPPDQVNVKLETALVSKTAAYDVFSIDIIDLPRYAAAGWVLPLDEFVTPEMKDDILPFAANGVIYDGKWLGLPWKAEWMSFTYNMEMVDKAGYSQAPETWDDMINVSLALKEKGIVEYPLVFTWGANYEQITSDYAMIVASLGGEIFNSEGEPVFNKGAGVEALQLMYDMVNKYKIVDPSALTIKGGGTRLNMLAGGQGAFAFLWGTPLLSLNDQNQSDLAGQFAISLAPAGKGGPFSMAGPMGLAITSTTKNKEAAWEFVSSIAGPEGEKYMFLQEGAPAGWKSVLQDEDVMAKLADAGGDIMAQQSEYLAIRPALPYYSEWSSAFQQAFHRVLFDKQTVKEALDELTDYTLELKSQFEK